MPLYSFTDYRDFEDRRERDIVIVGAGIAGLYCAWRLMRDDPSRKITLLERLNRTGGRLDTDLIEFPKGDVVREEEGGMRFNYGMQELMELFGALDLCDQIVDFPMSSAGNTNRYFIRGHNFTAQEAADSGQMIWSELYDLKPQEIGLSPTALITAIYNQIVLANGHTPKEGEQPEFWTRFRNKFTWKGIKLRDWQTWGLLADMGYSEECIEMLAQTIGFKGPFKGNGNAGDAFQILADFPKDPTYFTFRDGFSTLPNAILKDLLENSNVDVVLSTYVDSIDRGKGGFTVHSSQAPEYQNAQPGRPTLATHGRKVIIACATKAMKALFARSPALYEADHAPKIWEALSASLGMRLQKINLYFDHPWWENGTTGRKPVQYGPNFTDMPLNSAYPFYSLDAQSDLENGENGTTIRNAAAALTLYLDFTKTNFWNGLQKVGPMFTSDLQEQQNAKQPQTLYPASRAVVEAAKEQLSLLFGTTIVPEPVLTSYRLWDGEEDFGYAYHQWTIGADDVAYRDLLSNPTDHIYCCNESISDMQGWVMGSLRSANDALHHFGLDPLQGMACKTPPAPPSSAAAPDAESPRGTLWGL